MTYVIERMRPGDLSFVLDSWLRSFSDSRTAEAMHDYWRTQRIVAETLVGSGRVLVARPSESAQYLVGWLCYDGDALHYAYTRREQGYRRKGVCSALMEAAGELRRYTHQRDPQTRFLDRRGLAYDASLWAGVGD